MAYIFAAGILLFTEHGPVKYEVVRTAYEETTSIHSGADEELPSLMQIQKADTPEITFPYSGVMSMSRLWVSIDGV
jgi:hypothetical protein